MRQDDNGRRKFGRNVIDAALWLGRNTFEVTEVKTTLFIEHQVIRHESGVLSDDGLHSRAIGLDRENRSEVAIQIESRDEQTSVGMKCQSAWGKVLYRGYD
ncbi:hypothetical protein D3C86_1580400 [compost metagenome]